MIALIIAVIAVDAYSAQFTFEHLKKQGIYRLRYGQI